MVGVSTEQRPFTLIGIDPGTTCLGVAVFQFDLTAPSATVCDAFTIRLIPELHLVTEPENANERRHARLSVQRRYLSTVFQSWNPDQVASESPFMGQFARAFEALVECLGNIRETLRSYDASLALQTVDPPSVKNAVGVSGGSNQKHEMRAAVLALPTLTWDSYLNPRLLDEHAIDAVAVAYHQWLMLTNLRPCGVANVYSA